MSHISQREARRLRKRVEALECAENKRLNAWASEWPRGVNIASTENAAVHPLVIAVRTARKLRHAVVVVADEGGAMRYFALPLAGQR